METTSPAVNAGAVLDSVNGIFLVPAYEYVHPTSSIERIIVESIDAGAIEADVLHSTQSEDFEDLVIYPNPFADRITIDEIGLKESEIAVYSFSGENLNSIIIIEKNSEHTIVETKNLEKGMYVLRIRMEYKFISKF